MHLNNIIEFFAESVKSFIILIQYILVPLFIYQFVISIFGWFKRKEKEPDNCIPNNRFAVIVAAYNEEKVIGNIVNNLKSLNYPKDKYDIFVVADNCDDNTAKIAQQNGATVYERFDKTKKGKGYALEWMFEKILKSDNKYDAVCIFDADNLVSKNFLTEMDKHICKGHKVIQGYLDSKNPLDSLISASYSISYWLSNRLFQLARYYLGLSCEIGGTGFVIATDVLKEIGWGATCLTEDLEFTIKLILRGQKVYWADKAVVYDEKPVTLSQSWRQRKRWMQGQADCACRYIKSLLYKFIKDKDIVALDCALYVIQPMLFVLGGILLFLNLLKLISLHNFNNLFDLKILESVILFLTSTYISIIFLFAEKKNSFKIILYFFLIPLYNLTWIPIIIQGYIDKNKRDWVHTIHTKALDISDIENIKY